MYSIYILNPFRPFIYFFLLTVIHILKKLRGPIQPFIFTQIIAISVAFRCQFISGIISSQPKELLLRENMLVTNFLSFPSSDNLYFASFLKDIFTGYRRILGWQLFSFGILHMFFHSLLASMSFFEKATPDNHSLCGRT